MSKTVRVLGALPAALLLSACSLVAPAPIEESKVMPAASAGTRPIDASGQFAAAPAPDVYLKPLDGYRQDPLPSAEMAALRNSFAAYFARNGDEGALAKQAFGDFTARYVYKDGRLTVVVLVFAMQPEYLGQLRAGLAEVAKGGLGSAGTKLTLSGRDVYAGELKGMPTLIWLQNGDLIMVVGNTSADAQAYATAEIVANQDATAPHTTVTMPDANGAGWYRGDAVTIAVKSSDAGGSGASRITYRASGAHAEEGAIGPAGTITLHNEGITEIDIAAEDLDGNIESAQHFSVKLDRTAPSVSLRGATRYAIYESVAISCTASDDGSGLADECSGQSAGALPLGLGSHTLTRTVTDRAGNSSTAQFAYSVELTADVVAAVAAAVVIGLGALLLVTRRRRPAARAIEQPGAAM